MLDPVRTCNNPVLLVHTVLDKPWLCFTLKVTIVAAFWSVDVMCMWKLWENTALVTVSHTLPVDTESKHHTEARSQYLFPPVSMPSKAGIYPETLAKWGSQTAPLQPAAESLRAQYSIIFSQHSTPNDRTDMWYMKTCCHQHVIISPN